MNFENTTKSIMLTIAAGKTPVIVGERGIGKTSMMRDIANKLNMKLVTIEGNLLKEGELGGLPIPHANDQGIMVTDYAIHSKLRLIDEYLTNNPDSGVLLFIDEIR